MFAVLVLVLLTSVLVAIYRTGQLRALAIGFFIFSAGYLVVEGNFWPGAASVELPTRELVDWSFAALHGKPTADEDPFNARNGAQRQQDYRGICISSLAIVVGGLGGIIAQALHSTGAAQRPPPAPAS
jgi:hypothetical protein